MLPCGLSVSVPRGSFGPVMDKNGERKRENECVQEQPECGMCVLVDVEFVWVQSEWDFELLSRLVRSS